ncbi:hypothetical protein AB0F07_22775 [Streptomyces fructofermentans]|uniref:hypothetical protein n=1 Tax=Streptomyces fructofermentans TaxID=152141 RepID=UPI0034053379
MRKDQEDLRRKVLETVQQGTAGLREENRELRRRQEKMLTDLTDARTGVEALRRELAQAFSHIVGAPDPARAAERGSSLELVEREPRPLDVADLDAGDGWREEAVNEIPGPVGDGEEGQRARVGLPEVATVPASASATQGSVAVDAAPAEPSPAPVVSAAGDVEKQRGVDRAQHLESVLQAAAIASARVICHRDTWSFLIEQTSQHPHFRLPERINDLDDGMIETSVSGRSVLAVLVTMRKVSDDFAAVDEDMATWALACAVYERTRLAVTTRTRPDGARITTIVLDDRPTAVGQAA